MSRPWIAPLYGYLVCILSVIVFLIGIANLVDAIFDRANPLGSAFGPRGGSLTSFEAYRVTRDREPFGPRMRSDTARADTLTTAALRAEYQAVRADRIARTQFEATKRIVKNTLLVILAVVLFLWHWRWVRTQREPLAT
jgi:hypothetical protein